MTDPTTNAALAGKYDAVAYDSRALPLTHPDHIATVATMFGNTAVAPAACRMLELGCADGANLVPIAATFPAASFVGCDLSPRAIAAGRRMIADLGLANVTLHEQDLRSLPEALGTFDYIVAHGVYSWVPAPVRDALLALAARRLSPDGILYVSYNTYPGGHVRRAAWDILHHHVDALPDPRARLAAAREIASLLADEGATEVDTDVLLRSEFRDIAARTDSLLFHDDLAAPNDPVHFHEFIAHARRHGLAFVAEAQPWMMSTAGLAPRMRQYVAGLDPLRREQYLDFARFRRIRHSLLCRAGGDTRVEIVPARAATMQVGAPRALVRAIDEGRLPAKAGGGDAIHALLCALAEDSPRAMTFAEAARFLHGRGPLPRPVETMIADAWFGGTLELGVEPRAIAGVPGRHPQASPVARWQAQRQEQLTTLRHEGVRLADPVARQLLAALDGSRDRAQLAAALAPALPGRDAQAFVDDYLRMFARQALLLPAD
ncbi:MAG: class I SAM-dependent methyltransferase [Betaproteobacteria bacterium]